MPSRYHYFLDRPKIKFDLNLDLCFKSFKVQLRYFPIYLIIGGTYEIVLDGICPNGYTPLSNETECKALAGQTISNIDLGNFHYSGCNGDWTPTQTCFAYTSGLVYFVNRDCGQNPSYQTYRLICKKQGKNVLAF